MREESKIKLSGFRRSREAKGFSREGLMKESGLTYHVIRAADNGERVARSAAENLAVALGVKVTTLQS